MEHRKALYACHIMPSHFGRIGLVRRAGGNDARICRILLPEAECSMSDKIGRLFPGAVPADEGWDEICERIREFLAGKAVAFSLDALDFSVSSGFAKQVLLAVKEIPRSRVTTYGRLAAAVGVHGGARAVGNVMAGNPFPIVIPCHRVVQSDGSVGGFGGGTELKMHLLRLEGVGFDLRGRILPEHFFDNNPC